MNKEFDCVEMKKRLQAEMRDEEQRLGPEKMIGRRQKLLPRGQELLCKNNTGGVA